MARRMDNSPHPLNIYFRHIQYKLNEYNRTDYQPTKSQHNLLREPDLQEPHLRKLSKTGKFSKEPYNRAHRILANEDNGNYLSRLPRN